MKRLATGYLLFAVLAAHGCRQEMYDQPRLETGEGSAFFAFGPGERPRVEGTVARGELIVNVHLVTGRTDGTLATTFPFAIERADMERGMQQFNIYCAPCHDRTGSGRGMIVRRGFLQPASFHEQRLREVAPGYFFDVITNGYGAMYAYGARVAPADRWRIVAYIRALQRSQNAAIGDVPPAERENLMGGAQP